MFSDPLCLHCPERPLVVIERKRDESSELGSTHIAGEDDHHHQRREEKEDKVFFCCWVFLMRLVPPHKRGESERV